MSKLADLNALPADALCTELMRCCGSSRWAQGMAGARPFLSEADLFAKADSIWAGMGESDILEAMSHHPRIGGVDALRKKFAATAAWSGQEQAAVAEASESVLEKLKAGNDAYADRYGFVFLICATGKSAQEMLAALESRIDNGREKELRVAAAEQAKITRIRLEKLLS